MNKGDKNSILIITYVLALVAVALVFCNTTKYINPFWLGVLLLLLENFYLYPKIVKSYWSIFPAEIGIRRFIPVYNELCLFESQNAILVAISWGAIALVCGIFLLPLPLLGNVVGDVAALDLPYTLFKIFLVLVIINCIYRGVLLLRVYKEVKEWHKDLYGYAKAIKIIDVIAIISLFLPLAKSIGLFKISSYLSILCDNGYVLEEQEDEYEEM